MEKTEDGFFLNFSISQGVLYEMFPVERAVACKSVLELIWTAYLTFDG